MSHYETIAFWVNAKPFGKQRARTLKTGRSYTPAATKDAEQVVRDAWLESGGDCLPSGLPIDAMLEFHIARPSSHYRKGGELSAEGLRHPTPYRTKPDVDNATKLVLDALNGYAYRDDIAICNLTTLKCWAVGREGRIWVSLQVRIAEENARIPGKKECSGGAETPRSVTAPSRAEHV